MIGVPITKRFLPLLSAGILVLTFYTLRHTSVLDEHFSTYKLGLSRQHHWNADREGSILQLTKQQCTEAFPGHFNELDRALEKQLGKGRNITQQDLDDVATGNGNFRLMIYEQQLFVIDVAVGDIWTRAWATLHAIQRAIVSSPVPIPNMEFVLFVWDVPKHGGVQWAYSRERTQDDVWLMPDYSFWDWPEIKADPWRISQQKSKDVDAMYTWSNKSQLLYWRGSPEHNLQRGRLIHLATDKDWADIKVVDWSSTKEEKNSTKEEKNSTKEEKNSTKEEEDSTDVAQTTTIENQDSPGWLPMAEHCQHAYLMHIAGLSYSGRLKYLLNCRSLIFMTQQIFVEHFYDMLIADGPEQNYVQVKDDFSDLEEKLQHFKTHPEEAQAIAQRTVDVFRDRYLTPAAETCYWRALFEAYGSVTFEPEIWTTDPVSGKHVLRGTPFESFALMRSTEWDYFSKPPPPNQ